MRILFVRHGHPNYEKDCLTELGHLHAEAAAKRLLTRSNTPISAVAEAVGITDYNYFTKVFRSITGMTPSAYRNQNRRNIEKNGQ